MSSAGRLVLPCAALAAGAVVLSVSLWRELRAERLMGVQLQEQLAVRQAMSAPTRPAGEAGPAPPTSSPAARAGPGGAAPSLDATAGDHGIDETGGESAMLRDPEYRNARLVEAVISMRQIHAGAARELGLGAAEADALFELLGEQQLEVPFADMPALHDPAVLQQQFMQVEAFYQRQQAAIEAQLGAKYPQWQDYEASRPVRSRVDRLNAQLAFNGSPLDDAQVRALVTALVPEQKRMEQALMEMARGGAAPASREEALRIQADARKRMLDVARGGLNDSQFQTFAAMIESEQARTRAPAPQAP